MCIFSYLDSSLSYHCIFSLFPLLQVFSWLLYSIYCVEGSWFIFISIYSYSSRGLYEWYEFPDGRCVVWIQFLRHCLAAAQFDIHLIRKSTICYDSPSLSCHTSNFVCVTDCIFKNFMIIQIYKLNYSFKNPLL